MNVEAFQENNEFPSQTIGEPFNEIETWVLDKDALEVENNRENRSPIIRTGSFWK